MNSYTLKYTTDIMGHLHSIKVEALTRESARHNFLCEHPDYFVISVSR